MISRAPETKRGKTKCATHAMHHRNPSWLGLWICRTTAGAMAQSVVIPASFADADTVKSRLHLTIGDVAHQKLAT